MLNFSIYLKKIATFQRFSKFQNRVKTGTKLVKTENKCYNCKKNVDFFVRNRFNHFFLMKLAQLVLYKIIFLHSLSLLKVCKFCTFFKKISFTFVFTTYRLYRVHVIAIILHIFFHFYSIFEFWKTGKKLKMLVLTTDIGSSNFFKRYKRNLCSRKLWFSTILKHYFYQKLHSFSVFTT